jgi:MoxR-like ATPase
MDKFKIAFGHYDHHPQYYYLSDNNPLRATILLALKLGKPLLITGEPGTGKTQLAHWASWYLNTQQDNSLVPFLPEPFIFHTKTTSLGKDLFYQYDAISHFQDKEGRKRVAEFISLSAMGLAIAQTEGRLELLKKYPLDGVRNISALEEKPHSSVLLIDEIDKAPRDFTNDLLHEIENNRFYIPELEQQVTRSGDRRARILVILTSNSEKNLPDAFLRRCLFYNVDFPTEDELVKIVTSRLAPFISEIEGDMQVDFEHQYRRVLRIFNAIRAKSVVKPPSTSELLDWVKVLHLEGLINNNFDERNAKFLPPEQKKALQLSLYTLVKTREDLEEVEELLQLK